MKIILISLILAISVFYFLNDIMLPFIAGIIIAYLLNPLVEFFQNKNISRTISTTIVVCMFFIFSGILLSFVIPLLGHQIGNLLGNISEYKNGVVSLSEKTIDWVSPYLNEEITGHIKSSISSFSGSLAKWIIGTFKAVLGSGLAFVNIVSLMFLTPIVSFYMIRDWHFILEKTKRIIPSDIKEETLKVINDIDLVISAYLRGQGLVCLCLGSFYGIALSVIGLPYGFLIGFSAGLLSFIPFLGTIFGITTALLVAFFHSPEIFFIIGVILIFVIGQILEGNFLTPNLVGDRVGLHPVWIIFSVLAGGSLLGFLGVLIAIPSAAIIGVLIRYAFNHFYEKEIK